MNRKKIVVKTTEYIFCTITAIQVIFGLMWAFCQFPHMQNWQETYEYLDISTTFVMDEYVSFLYPVLLKLCTGIESLAGIPFYMPVYVIQSAAGILSAWLFVRIVLKMEKSKAVWAVGYLTSFPLLLQFHMSVRTESLEVSGILLLLTFFETSPIGAAVTTLLLIWLNPDMALICVAAWIVFLLQRFIEARRNKKETGVWNIKPLLTKCIVFLLALVIGVSVNGLVQTPGSRGRIQKTFWAAAFQRVVTDYFSRSYVMWDDEVRTTYTIEEAMEMANRSDNMMYEVGPALETDWGKERANEMYRQMTTDCFRVRTKDVVYQIRDDLVDSVLMPFSVLWQDNGERMSQTGWNYGELRRHSPKMSVYFLNFSVYALILLIISGLIRCIINRNIVSHMVSHSMYVWIIALVQCFRSVLSTANRVNYSLLVLMIFCWCYMAVPKSTDK